MYTVVGTHIDVPTPQTPVLPREKPAALTDVCALGVGHSLVGGNHIYSMFEAGFGSGTQPKPCGGTAGNAMSGTYGECDGGLSVELCELHLAAICNGACRTAKEKLRIAILKFGMD